MELYQKRNEILQDFDEHWLRICIIDLYLMVKGISNVLQKIYTIES